VCVTVVSAQVNSDRERYIFYFIPCRQCTNVCSGIFIGGSGHWFRRN